MSASVHGLPDPLVPAGLEELMRCFRAIVREELAARGVVDHARPLTALELCERWHVTAETPALQLHKLAKQARKRRLKAMAGTRGWGALYALADVIDAEGRACGK